MNFFNKKLATTSLALMFIAAGSSVHAMEEEFPENSSTKRTARFSQDAQTKPEEIPVKQIMSTARAFLDENPEIVHNVVQNAKQPAVWEDALKTPEVQALNTPEVNELLGLFGTSFQRLGEKAASHTRRETERQENQLKYGHSKTNREIEKLITRGQLERK